MPSTTNSTATSLRRAWMAVAIAILALAASGVVQAQSGQETDTVRPAGIHTGTCGNPGERIHELDALRVAPNSREAPKYVGAEGASVVESSDTTIPSARVAELTDSPHLIAVFEAEGSETIVACGEIGGFTGSSDGDLDIGLREQGGSGMSGVARLDAGDDEDDLEVDIYLARDVTGTATPGA